MNQIIKQVNAACFKVLIATITVHVFTYKPYMNQLIKQVNQTSFTYRKLDCCLY